MFILLSSNIISGAYTVVEMLLAVVLGRLLTSITETLNVKAVYEDRRKLSLTTSKIPAILDTGLTVPWIHSATALVFIIVTLLMTAGQFGIVGVEKEYEEVTVKYLVNKAPPSYVLNVEDHISMGRKGLSKEIMLLRQFPRCQHRTSTFLEIYAFIYDGDEVERSINDLDGYLNITCVTNDFGFEKKVAHLHRKEVNWSSNVDDSLSNVETMPTHCTFNVNESDIVWGKVANASVETNCSWTAKEAWCYTGVYCIAVWEYSGYYFLVTTNSFEGRIVQYILLENVEEFGREKLKAGVMLMAMGVAKNPNILKYMLSSWVERNATVRKTINPSRQATKIHVPLLSVTIVPAVIILLFTACIALYLWTKVIFIPGRQGYNHFNSAADLLSCAAVEKFRDGGCRYLRSGGISVGSDGCGEYASPVKFDAIYGEGKP